MRVILFGSTGMLGNYMDGYLSKYYTVYCINRRDFDIENDEWTKLYGILLSIATAGDVVVNCAGVIPQRCDVGGGGGDDKRYIRVNTLFPHKLNEYANILSLKFIHISTDCVFSGNGDGGYDETSVHDAETMYGLSKSLGESPDMTIIRTSIVGEELYNKKSLIEWLISKRGRVIDGYSEFWWNGITCLQLCKIVECVIHDNKYWRGVRHFYSPNAVSKYQLCSYINEIYDLNIVINVCDKCKKNMTISSIYDTIIEIPELVSQLKEQYDFMRS